MIWKVIYFLIINEENVNSPTGIFFWNELPGPGATFFCTKPSGLVETILIYWCFQQDSDAVRPNSLILHNGKILFMSQ